MSVITRNGLLSVLGLCIILGGDPRAVNGEDALRLELTALAADIAKLIDKKGLGTVAVGGFTAASNIQGSSGPDVQLQLADALEKAGLTVNADEYRYEVAGNYLGTTDKQTGAFGVKVVARVIDSDGTTLAEFPRFIFGEETVPRMLGVSVQTRPGDDALERSRKVKEALKKPQSHLKGTRISTSADTPYAIEVLVRQDGEYVARSAAKDSRDRPFVGIDRDAVYAVRLTNDSPHEAAVNVSIDGISVFRFSSTKSTYWIVPAGKSVLIKGWHKDSSTSVEFKVTGYDETAAARLNLKPSADIGQISAAFSAAWVDDKDKPADEPSGRGTGFGDEIQFGTQQVQRNIGHVRDHIVVRYER